MIYEFHVVQSFPASNLNRDDSGLPKEVSFGGYRRARVSSQSWKRAMRDAFREELGEIRVATRTKRALDEVVNRQLAAAPGLDPAVALHRAAVVLEADPLGLKLVAPKGDATVGKTGQLLFFRAADLDALAAVAQQHADELDAEPSTVGNPQLPDAKAAKGKLSKAAASAVKSAMTSPGDAVDIALFGRMIAEMPEAGVDASCQVAHAMGTHRLTPEDDFYTAVDDLKSDETEGADMIGTVGYNASCFYRYAAVKAEQLAKNLGVDAIDDEAVSTAVAAFARAFVTSLPTGKQNSFAAHTPPSAVLVVRRNAGQWNLANAFVKPVSPLGSDAGVDELSTSRMIEHFAANAAMFGRASDEIEAVLLTSLAVTVPDGAPVAVVGTLDEVVAHLGGAA